MDIAGAVSKKPFHIGQRGIIFYLVVTMIVIALILGGAFIFFLRSEVHMITLTQKSEVCLYLSEAGANEAFYRLRQMMNDPTSPVYETLREKYTDQPTPVPIATPIAEDLADDFSADLAVWATYVNRQKFLKDLYNAEIPNERQDDRESCGTLRVQAEIKYRGMTKLLTVDRDLKVINPYPPKGDFSLWVKNAASDTMNPWISQAGVQTKSLMVLNGVDRQPYKKAADVFLGGGKALTLRTIPGTPPRKEHAGPLSMGGKKKPIILNITGSFPFGDAMTRYYLGQPVNMPGFDQLDCRDGAMPNNDLRVHTDGKNLSFFGAEKISPENERSAFQIVGHDSVMNEEYPVYIRDILGRKRPLPQVYGCKYYIDESYNRHLSPTDKKYLDITRSGLDLYSVDYATMKKLMQTDMQGQPQYAHRVYGHVYSSMVRLRAADIGDLPAGIYVQAAWYFTVDVPSAKNDAFLTSDLYKKMITKGNVKPMSGSNPITYACAFAGFDPEFKTDIMEEVYSDVSSFGSLGAVEYPDDLEPIKQKILQNTNLPLQGEDLDEKLKGSTLIMVYEIPNDEFNKEKAAKIAENFGHKQLVVTAKPPAPIWGMCPWRDPTSFQTDVSSKMDILDDPVYWDEQMTIPWLLTVKPPKKDAMATPSWLSNYSTYKRYMTQVFRTPYDYSGTTHTVYENRVRGYKINTAEWEEDGRFLDELSWNKISKTYGRWEDFEEESGLRKTQTEQKIPIMFLDGIWLITDFQPIVFEQNTVYAGKGILIFMDVDVFIDGMHSWDTYQFNKANIDKGEPYICQPLFQDLEDAQKRFGESKLTIVLLSFGKTTRKIHVTNRCVEASICAPTSTVQLDTEYSGADSQGERKLDLDVYGNLVLGELHLSQHRDGSQPVPNGLDGDPNKELADGGGIVRWDPFMVPLNRGGEYTMESYHVSISRKVSYWNIQMLKGEEE